MCRQSVDFIRDPEKKRQVLLELPERRPELLFKHGFDSGSRLLKVMFLKERLVLGTVSSFTVHNTRTAAGRATNAVPYAPPPRVPAPSPSSSGWLSGKRHV